MAVDGHLNFDTLIDTKGFTKGLDSMKKMLGELAAAVGLAYSAKAIADFGKQAVGLASDMQEVQNVVDTAFGAMAYKMEEFANSSITQYGISKLAAKQTGSTFAAMASGMQLPLDTASDMAIALTGLSADMASFYNVSQDIASTALKSIFTGETETLKQFGIVMTEANLNAYAMSQGIKKTVREMTEAEKVMLRYQYVMQATALAQGDFAKTSDGWANQMRILSEQWKELSTIVGNVILNVALPAVRHLNDALSKLITHANNAYNALAEFFGWEQTQTNTVGVVTEISAAVDEQNALTDAVNETAKAQENSLAGFDKINKLSGTAQIGAASAATPVTVTPSVNTAPMQESIQKTVEETETIFSAFADEVDFSPLLGSLEELKEAASPIIDHVGDGLFWVYENVLIPLGSWVIEDALPASLGVLSAALGVLDASIEALKPYGQWLWDEFIAPLAEWSGDIITTGLEDLADALGDIEKWIRENPDAAVKIGLVSAAVAGLIAALRHPALQNAAATAFGSESALVKNLTNLAGTIGIVTVGTISWGYVFTEIESNLDDILSTIEKDGGFAGFISGWLEYVREDVEAFFNTSEFGKLWYEFWSGIGEDLSEVFGDMPTTFSDFWEDFGDQIYDWTQDSEQFISDMLTSFGGLYAGFATQQLADLANDLAAAWTQMEDFGEDIHDGVQEVEKFFKDGYKNIQNALSGAKSWADGKMRDIKTAFSSAPEFFKEKFTVGWSNVKSAFADTESWFADLNSGIEGAFASVDSYLGTKFGDGWTSIKEQFSGAKAHFETIWNDMKNAFANGDVGGWFREQFQAAIDNIESVFDGLGGYWEGIWENLSNGAMDGVNWLLDKLDALGYHIETLLNGLVDGFNAVLSVDIPSDVPLVGGTKFGLNMAYVDIPPIPRLATGTVVPANYGEFLAVLGDNRREAEVVSPLSTIERAVENVMQRYGREDGDIHLNVKLDSKTIYRSVIRRNQESIRMTGRNPLNPAWKGATTS